MVPQTLDNGAEGISAQSCCARVKKSRANLHPSATVSSSSPERPENKNGAMKTSADKSKRLFLVFCSSSSEDVSSQQAHIAGKAKSNISQRQLHKRKRRHSSQAHRVHTAEEISCAFSSCLPGPQHMSPSLVPWRSWSLSSAWLRCSPWRGATYKWTPRCCFHWSRLWHCLDWHILRCMKTHKAQSKDSPTHRFTFTLENHSFFNDVPPSFVLAPSSSFLTSLQPFSPLMALPPPTSLSQPLRKLAPYSLIMFPPSLGSAPLCSNILFLAICHKPFCATIPPTSNSSLNLLHAFPETFLISPSIFHYLLLL